MVVRKIKIKQTRFRYPKVMTSEDRRGITVKSGYLASVSLRSEHKVVYHNLVKKNAIESVKNTTGHAITALNRRYPERYLELREKFQRVLVQNWEDLVSDFVPEEDHEELAVDKVDVLLNVRRGFFSRLFGPIRRRLEGVRRLDYV